MAAKMVVKSVDAGLNGRNVDKLVKCKKWPGVRKTNAVVRSKLLQQRFTPTDYRWNNLSQSFQISLGPRKYQRKDRGKTPPNVMATAEENMVPSSLFLSY